MANIPANIGPTLDAAFGQALTTAGGWTNAGGNVGFSLSSLLNEISAGGSSPTGPAGGDLSGTYPNPSINTINAGILNLGPSGNTTNLSPYLYLNAASGGVSSPCYLEAVYGQSTTGSLNYFGLNHTWGPIGQTYSQMSWLGGATPSLNLGYVGNTFVSLTPSLILNASNGSAAFTPKIATTTTGTISVVGAATATSIGTVLNNSTTLTSGGKIVSFQNNGTEESSIDYQGNLAVASVNVRTHVIPSGTVPTVGTFNAGFGTVTGNAITGGDAAGIISFTTGTASAITANQALCTVTLATTYSSTAYAVMVANATASGALDASDYYGVPATANTFIIYNTSAITPSSTTLYKLQFMTMGAGATS